MKTNLNIRTIILLFTVVATTLNLHASNQVNALAGDRSFILKFGFKPTEKTNEKLRIQTHLSFVEKLLRKRDVSSLSAELQHNRKQLLDLLHTYWTAGVFPSNFDFPNTRKPCFIDRENRICAVGYLVEQTAGIEAANYINQHFPYDNLLDMKDPLLENWISGSGLTKTECALIQPTYEFERQYDLRINEEPVIKIYPGDTNKKITAPVYQTEVVEKRTAPTKAELKLRKELADEQELNTQLVQERDSLLALNFTYRADIDSLTKLNQENKFLYDTQSAEFNQKYVTQQSIIWSLLFLLSILLIGVLFFLFRKVNKPSHSSRITA